MLAVDEEH